MPANGPVSLNIQTIFCLIPILDIYAAYRIKKLRKYLLIMIVFVGIPLGVLNAVISPVGSFAIPEFVYADTVFSVGTWIGSILIAIYLIRRWSVQWNKAYEIH